MTDWVDAAYRLPKPEEAGAFGVVEVIKECAGRGWQGICLAKPVFIGGNRDRVLWVDPDDTGKPIENSSWFVSHWRPFPKFPEPKTQVPA